MLSADRRGANICEMFQKARTDVELLRGFWNLTEKPIIKMGSRVISHHMAVNSLLDIPCVPVPLPLDDGDDDPFNFTGTEMDEAEENLRVVTVTGRVLGYAAATVARAKGEDGSEGGTRRPVQARLLSRVVRTGQDEHSLGGEGAMSAGAGKGAKKRTEGGCVVCGCCYKDRREARAALKQQRESMRNSGASTDGMGGDDDEGYVFPLADTLVIHMHGGGFVAQSSASHETYLKRWAAHLHTPILSIDYTLSPESDDTDEPGAQYPVAVNECFFVYCWALKNARALGSTAEKVVLVGDSAGANLALAVALKAAATGARRPSAVVACYPPLFISLSCSPSRLLSLLDPMLSLTALELCLSAYRGSNAQDFGEFTRSCGPCDDTATDWLLSPATAPDELLKLLPPVYLMAAELDPLLDDSVIFAKRLEGLGCDVHYTVIPGVSHGFLNLAVATAETSTTNAACNQCEAWLYTALGSPPRPASIDEDIRESKKELEAYHMSSSAASREKFVISRLSEVAVEGFLAAGARAADDRGDESEEAKRHREVAGRFGGLARMASKSKHAAVEP